MSFVLISGIIAGVLSLLAYVPRAIHIIRKGATSSSSWLIWTLSNCLVFLSYINLGEMSLLWVPFAYFIGSGLITILAFNYSADGWNAIFKWLLAAAILSGVRWLFLSNPWLILAINALIYMIAYAGIIQTKWKSTKKETWSLIWGLFFAGAFVNLFAIPTWNVMTAAYPVMLFVMNGIVFGITVRNSIRNQKSEEIAGTGESEHS